MAFTGFSKSLGNVYTGFGKGAAAASAGAAAAALIAPAIFKTDDRGYARTAAITTPLIAAGYIAAPGAIKGFGEMGSQFGQFWKNKPFTFTSKGPVWDGFPDMARKMQDYGPHVRQAMADAMNRRAGKFYTSAERTAFNPAEAAAEFEANLSGFEKAASTYTESHRLVLSHALDEARAASLTPDQAVHGYDTVGTKLRSLSEVRSEFEANRGNEQFLRVMNRRMKTALKDQIIAAEVPRNANAPSSWAVSTLSPDAAIAEMEMQKAGDAMRRARAVQDGIKHGWIGKDSKIVYSMQDGKRGAAIGAEIFHPFKQQSFSLSFTDPSRPTATMGSKWQHRGVARKFWDPIRGVQDPTDLILSKLSEGYDPAQKASQSAFIYGGVTDPLDPLDVKMHGDLQNAVKSEEALLLSSMSANPNPYGGFGADGSKTFDKLDIEGQVAALKAAEKQGLRSMGPEGKLSKGTMQLPELRGISVGQPGSMSIQDPTYRAGSKAVQFNRESLDGLGLRQTAVDADFFRDVLHVESSASMSGAVMEEGMITPQMKSLFGDIPEEAEAMLNQVYNRRVERQAFKSWKRDYLEDLRDRSKSARSEWFEEEELRQLWKKSKDFQYFDAQRVKTVNKWWSTKSGQTYAEHAHEILAKEIGNGALADDLVVKKAFSNYKQFLSEDPLRLHVRRLGRLGEYTALNSPAMRKAEVDITNIVHVDDLHIAKPSDGMALEEGIVGWKNNRPVEVPRNSVLERYEQTEDGWALWIRRNMPFAGAKSDAGLGPKGGELVMDDLVEAGDLWKKQLDVINFVGVETGTGVILPRTTQRISEARVASFKTKLPVSQLLEDSLQIARDMVSGSYSEESRARSERFLNDLQQNHLFHPTSKGIAESTKAVHSMSEADQIRRSQGIADTAESYMNEIGAMGKDTFSEYPLFRAFRTASKVRADAGRESLSFNDWMFRTNRFTNVKPWAHDLLNVQKEVGVTYDMMNELARTGAHESVAALYGKIQWKHGDPAEAAKVVDYLKGGRFDSPLGNVIAKDDIPRVQGRNVDARTGNSIFNPANPAVQDNYSIDMGGILKDVEVGGVKTDLRYIPSLGMKSYKGGTNPYEEGWSWTDLEKKKADLMESLQDMDWSKIDPQSNQAKAARARASAYMNQLVEDLSNQGGPLRAEGVLTDAAAGYTAHYAEGAGASPFDAWVPHNVYARQSKAMQAKLAGEGVYGPGFRHPVSAGYQLRYRYSQNAHLETNQFGLNPALSGPYQMDHDEDPFIAMFHDESAQGQKASAEAAAAIADKESAQWKNLRVSKMFQAMEDSHNISFEMFEAEAEKKGLRGKGSYLTELSKAIENDQAGIDALREKVLRGRLAHGSTGSYSNLSTKLQLMLSNNPLMQPGDWDAQMMGRLAQYTRQAPISAAKGKMSLGSDPSQLRNSLNRALSRGKEGVGDAQQIFTQIAGGAGFEGIYDEEMGNLTGITHKLLKEDDKVVFKDGLAQYGEAFKAGETINTAEHFAASPMGRDTIEKMVTGRDVRKVNMFADLMVKKKLSAEDGMRLWNSGVEELSPELTAMYRKGTQAQSGFSKVAGKVFGESGSTMADNVSDMLGAANEALKDAAGVGKGSMKPAAKVMAAGLGVAAVAGLLTSSIRSSNSHRPEERIGVTDHVPGAPIAGARSSVNPKRRVLPGVQGVKTMVVSRVQQSLDLEVRAKTQDQGAQHEVAKMVERMSGGNGNTNITVNRVGSWKQSASKLRLRSQMRDELDRY